MNKTFSFHEGTSPLLVSVPHDGWQIPSDIVQHMSGAGRAIPDTDWHVSQLYNFVKESGASLLSADFSRYVVDLNRPADDASLYEGQLATGLCPLQTFGGADIYLDPIEIDKEERVARYWRPYHERLRQTLQALRERHGYALLWDAHSIPSSVPTLFDGELPVLNIGTFDGQSCAAPIADSVLAVASASPYDVVMNARFKGGYITRQYGDPENGIHAVQLELAQRAYMQEKTLQFDQEKAAELRATLKLMLDEFQKAASQ